MSRIARSVFVGSALILCTVLVLKGSALLIPSGAWQATGNLSSARAGAAAALLPDGRIIVSGGDAGIGPSPTADFFNADGTVSAAPPMIYARSQHASVTLQDGRVLVAGGLTAGGSATSTAELFDPVANQWTSAGVGMHEARSGATATLLQDGRVMISGGQNGTLVSSTVEVFDPILGTFTVAGMMSSPRTQHAATLLQDGRVLITGGFNGSTAVASTDIFDPAAGTVAAGPNLSAARFGHSATTLLNGVVAVIGGNNGNSDPAQSDVTPVEMVDFTAASPAFTTIGSNLATPREGHRAILLPNNNGILILGGTSAGTAVASAELFTPQVSAGGGWSYNFASTGAMTTPRGNAAASANQVNGPSSTMQRNGMVAVAGGKDASGNATSSSEAYGYVTVQTDQGDYAPGTTVTITGSGWQPGETVTLILVESPLVDTHPVMTAVADANGNIFNNQFSPDAHDVSIRFFLTAVGSASGLQAQNTFTDASNVKAATITMEDSTCTTATTTFGQGQTICASVNVTSTNGSGANSFFIEWFNPSNTVVRTTTEPVSLGTVTDTLPTTASTPTGTWTVKVCNSTACPSGQLVASTTFTLQAAAMVNFATDNPAGMNGATVNVTSVSYTQPNGSAGNTSYSFTAPGPAGSVNNIQTKPQTSVSFTFPTTVSFNSVQYVLTAIACNGTSCSTANISTGQGSFTDGATATTETVTATYVAQFAVTFQQSGIGGDTTNTVVSWSGTQAGSPASGALTAAQIGASGASINFDSGTSVNYSYSAPLASTTSGKQYRLVSTTPASPLTVTAAVTLTGNYQAQWQVTFKAVDQSSTTISDSSGTVVTVNSAGQSTNPYQAYFDQGASVSFSFQSPLASSTAGKQYRLVSASATSPLTVTAAVTVTGNYQAQWQVTFKAVDQSSTTIADGSGTVVTVNSAGQSTNPYQAYFDQGASVSFSFQSPLASGTAGKQYRLVSASATSPLTVTAAVTVTGNYQAQWQVTFKAVDQSSTTISDSSGTVVTVNSAGQSTNPYQAYFDQGASVSFSFQSPLASGTAGKQYRMVSASATSPLTVTAAVTVTGNYQAQWQVTFKAVDQSSTTISDSSGTVVTVNSAGQSTNPYQAYFDQGASVSFSFQSPLASSTAGKQYRMVSASATSPLTVTAAVTVTGNYQAQWQVTFNLSGVSMDVAGGTQAISIMSPSAQSVTFSQFVSNSYSEFFDAGSNITYSFANPLASTTPGKQYALTSTSPNSITGLAGATTVTATYKIQWQVTFTPGGISTDIAAGTQVISITSPSAQSVTFSQFVSNSYSEFFDAGSNVTYSFANPMASTAAGKQYALTATSPSSITGLAGATTVTATYKVQYQVTFTQTNIPSGDIAPATTVVSVNGTPEAFSSLPFNEYFDEGSAVPYSYASPIASSNAGEQFVLTSTTPASIPSLSGPTSVNGAYKVQFQITFAQAGMSGDQTGTIVTVNGNPQSTVPYQAFFDSGSMVTYTYSSPVASGVSGKQYVLTTPAPMPGSGFMVASAITITGTYKVQYQLTVAVTTGVPNGLSNISGGTSGTFYDSGTVLTLTAGAPVADGTGKQWRFDSWSGTTAGMNPSLMVTMNAPQSITANYVAQYQLTIAITSGVPNGLSNVTGGTNGAFYDSGTVLTLMAAGPVADGAGKQWRFDSWSGTTAGMNSSLMVTMNAPQSMTANYVAQYQLTLAVTTVVPNGANNVTGGTNGAFYDTGTMLNLTAGSPVNDGAGKRWRFDHWSGDASGSADPVSVIMSAARSVTANYVVQFLVTFTQSGISSADVNPAATVVTVNASNAVFANLPVNDWFDTGSNVTYGYANPVASTATSKRYILTGAAPVPGSPFVVTTTVTVSATYKAQFDTQTMVTSSANPSTLGQSISFTATVSTISAGGGTPSGTVQFKIDGNAFGAPVALVLGNATGGSISTLSVGPHAVEADYSPDTDSYVMSMGTLSGGQQVNFGFVGLQAPYAPPPATFNVQRTMPLKWQYTNSSGMVVNSSAANPMVIIHGPYTCGTSDNAGSITVNDSGNSGYQYDTTTNTWQFNWQVKGNAPGCYDISIQSQQSGQKNGAFPINVTGH